MNTKNINSKWAMTLVASPCNIPHNAFRSLLIIDYINLSNTLSVFMGVGTSCLLG